MKASKLVLGTVQFGLDYGINNTSGKPDLKTVFAILDEAYQNNVAILDSAEAYGNAHEVIGQYHQQSANRFKIITKFSSSVGDPSGSLTDRVLLDIKTLHVNHLHAYMFHSFRDFEIYFEKFKPEISELKKKGLIRLFGVSIYTNAEFEKLLRYKEVELVQLPFNLLDNDSQRGVLLQKAKDRGMEVHSRSVFLQGLFFKDTNTLPGKLLPLKPHLNSIANISGNNLIDLSALSLNYVLQQKKIDHVLIGVDTVTQLKQNLSALTHNLSPDLLEQINSLNVQETELLNPSNWK